MLNQEKEFKGLWFIPGLEQDLVPGILKYIPNKPIRLELIGNFGNNKEDKNGRYFLLKNRHYPIIHGEVSDGKSISLFNCHRGQSSLNFSCSFPLVSYQVETVLHGTLLNSNKERKFDSMRIDVPLLLEWINLYPTNLSYLFDEKKQANGFELSYDPKSNQQFSFCITPELTIKLLPFSYCSDNYCENVSIIQGYKCFLETNHPQSMVWFFSQREKLLDFISLATFQEVECTSTVFFSNEEKGGSSNGEEYLVPITCYQILPYKPVKRKKYGYLLPFEKVKDELSDVMSNWFALDVKMKPILYHLKKSIQPKNYYDSTDFLIVIQGLEGYHRRFRTNKQMGVEKRLEKLLHEFEDIEIVEDLNINVLAVASTRHYYSHFFSLEDSDKIYDGIELYSETKKLKVLLTCCVLNELGFIHQQIDNLLSINDNPIL